MTVFTYRSRSWYPIPPESGQWTGDATAGLLDSDQTLVDTKVKSVTPNFWRRKASGEILPVLPYTRVVRPRGHAVTRVSWDVSGYADISHGPYRDYIVKGLGFPSYLPDEFSINNLYNYRKSYLRNELRAKLQEKLMNVDFDLPVFLGEGKETIGLLSNAVKKTARYLDGFRNSRRNFLSYAQYVIQREYTDRSWSPEYRKVLRDLNDMHLQFQYGWKPLASDVEDAYQFVVKTLAPELHSKKAVHDFFVATTEKQNFYSGYGATVEYSSILEYKYELWMGGLLRDPEAFNSLPVRLGVDNLGSIALTAWELLRFSFLIDYVSNMQSFIGNLSFAYLKLEPTTLYESSKITCSQYVRIRDIHGINSDPTLRWRINNSATNSVKKQTHFKFQRVPLTWRDLVVRFQLEVPDWAQVLKATSLLYAAVDRASTGMHRS